MDSTPCQGTKIPHATARPKNPTQKQKARKPQLEQAGNFEKLRFRIQPEVHEPQMFITPPRTKFIFSRPGGMNRSAVSITGYPGIALLNLHTCFTQSPQYFKWKEFLVKVNYILKLFSRIDKFLFIWKLCSHCFAFLFTIFQLLTCLIHLYRLISSSSFCEDVPKVGIKWIFLNWNSVTCMFYCLVITP